MISQAGVLAISLVAAADKFDPFLDRGVPVGFEFVSPDGDQAIHQFRAKGRADRRRTVERVERVGQVCRQPADAASVPDLRWERVRILIYGLDERPGLPHSRQSKPDDGGEHKIGVAGPVDGLHLHVGQARPRPRGAAYQAHGRFPVLQAPARVGARPVAWLQPLIADDRRSEQARRLAQVIDDSGYQVRADLRDSVRAITRGEDVLAVTCGGEVDVAAIADLVPDRHRREGHRVAVLPSGAADDQQGQDVLVDGRDRRAGRQRYLYLPRAILRVQRLQLNAGDTQGGNQI